MLNDYEIIPRTRLTTPHNYDTVIVDHYWRVTPEGDGIIYTRSGNYSLQANTNKRISDRIIPSIPSKVEFIPVAYIPYGKIQ